LHAVYGLGEAARRRNLSRLGAYLLPGAQRQWPDARAARSTRAPGACQARAYRHRPQPGLELGHHFYLYVLLDIFSRYVVGWLVASTENAGLASALIEETCDKYGIARDTLTLHSDRGSPMRAKTTAELLADLGVAASFSRPRVSNDNPFSEAQFKTLKYRPEFPARFDGIEHARVHLHCFFGWYNDEHRHSGIGFMTPAAVHFGQAAAMQQQRAAVLAAAYRAHPERFKGKHPTPPALPEIVGINLHQPKQRRPRMT
jgi:putative transposase